MPIKAVAAAQLAADKQRIAVLFTERISRGPFRTEPQEMFRLR
jgi:hypothetical protein